MKIWRSVLGHVGSCLVILGPCWCTLVIIGSRWINMGSSLLILDHLWGSGAKKWLWLE